MKGKRAVAETVLFKIVPCIADALPVPVGYAVENAVVRRIAVGGKRPIFHADAGPLSEAVVRQRIVLRHRPRRPAAPAQLSRRIGISEAYGARDAARRPTSCFCPAVFLIIFVFFILRQRLMREWSFFPPERSLENIF